MGRIFKDCFQMIQEVDRELSSCGITVTVKHYQNKELTGEDQNTKELIGVNFTISSPLRGVEDMVKFMFKDEAETVMAYCREEAEDRFNRPGSNPGKSWEIRMDLWQKLMSRNQEGKFDYTYSERLHPLSLTWDSNERFSQLAKAIDALKDDEHSRRAMVMVFTPEDTLHSKGAETRIPCSISYQFLIRNNKLHCIYYIRSNDYFKHFAVDIVMTGMTMQYMVDNLKEAYPSLEVGPLHYMAGSLHAYHEDLKNWVIF